MAIIRMAASAGVALIALAAIVPAASQAQAPRAPLQLVPGPDQAKPAPRAASNRGAKRVSTPAGKPVAKASNKAARTTTAVANRRQARPATTSNARRARVAVGKPVARPPGTPPPIHDRAQGAPPILAQGASSDGDDHVMRDGDSVSLVGRLPWWRNDAMQPVNYGSAEAESKVLEAAAVWLAANGMVEADRPAHEPAAPATETIDVADSGEVNDIDLAAEPVSAPPTPSFLQSLLALIGGVASAVADTLRLLFA
jgi:hypothetical protein